MEEYREEDLSLLVYDDDDPEHSWEDPVLDKDLLNLSDTQYLSRILGPRRMGLEVIRLLCIIYTTISLDSGAHDLGVRHHLPHRDPRQLCCLPGHLQTQIHAHGYQLLSLLSGCGRLDDLDTWPAP